MQSPNALQHEKLTHDWHVLARPAQYITCYTTSTIQLCWSTVQDLGIQDCPPTASRLGIVHTFKGKVEDRSIAALDREAGHARSDHRMEPGKP